MPVIGAGTVPRIILIPAAVQLGVWTRGVRCELLAYFLAISRQRRLGEGRQSLADAKMAWSTRSVFWARNDI